MGIDEKLRSRNVAHVFSRLLSQVSFSEHPERDFSRSMPRPRTPNSRIKFVPASSTCAGAPKDFLRLLLDRVQRRNGRDPGSFVVGHVRRHSGPVLRGGRARRRRTEVPNRPSRAAPPALDPR